MNRSNINNLEKIARILRRDSLIMTTEAGSGHPTSCLSCAEIIASLFFKQMQYDIKNSKNPNNDIFILSKGHAAPILYAAYARAGASSENILNLRKPTSSFEGHPMPRSFPWVLVPTGSLGQGISNAVGMAIGLKLRKQKNSVYVLLGDSECAEGSVYEAIQLAVHRKLNNLTIIVDVNRLGQSGETLLGHNIIAYEKRFKAFGCTVVRANGHDIPSLLKSYKVKSQDAPQVILAKTYKGNGVSFLKNNEGKHGKALTPAELSKALVELPEVDMPKISITKPNNKFSNIPFKKKVLSQSSYQLRQLVATREAYGVALKNIYSKQLIVLDGETSNSTGSGVFSKKYPEKYIECFIAEQNMVGMATGLASIGFVPFVSGFAAFLSRAHDQIRMAALGELPVRFVGSHAGVSIGEDGPSQMALEDISLFRSLPKSIVLYPSDGVSTEKLVYEAYNYSGISYIRTSRPKTPVIYKKAERFPLGDFKVFLSSKDNKDTAVIVAAGITLHEALQAQKDLAREKIFVSVVDCYSIKPFNSKKFKKRFSGKKIIVVEDHYPEGGIGEMLSGSGILLSAHLAIREIPHSAPSKYLLEKHKISAKAISKTIRLILKE